MYIHRISLENKKTETNSHLELISKKMLNTLKSCPEKFDPKNIIMEVNMESKDLLKGLDITESRVLTSLLCEAVGLNCPTLASLIASAGGKTYTLAVDSGKTALHHTLDSKTGLEEMLLTHFGASPYIDDMNKRKPIEMMQEEQKIKVERVGHINIYICIYIYIYMYIHVYTALDKNLVHFLLITVL